MDEMRDIVKLAVDNYKGCVQKYSASEANETLRNALIAANNGSTTLNYRDIRDGKCAGLFALIEEILDATVVEGLMESDLFNKFVDYRNVALGDKPVFVTEDSELFVVAEAADGTQGLRRQRLDGKHEYTIPTSFKAVRIYEELNRVLAGRVDFNEMINKVAQSFEQQILNEIYTLFYNISAADIGGSVYVVTSGSMDEEELLTLVEHVEAAAGGKTATIVGTKAALRNLAGMQTDSVDSHNDLYHKGFLGWFYGTPTLAIPQRHKINSTTFVMPDDVLIIMAGDMKPVKFVYEGEPLVIPGDPLTNADLTQELTYAIAA